MSWLGYDSLGKSLAFVLAIKCLTGLRNAVDLNGNGMEFWRRVLRFNGDGGGGGGSSAVHWGDFAADARRKGLAGAEELARVQVMCLALPHRLLSRFALSYGIFFLWQ